MKITAFIHEVVALFVLSLLIIRECTGFRASNEFSLVSRKIMSSSSTSLFAKKKKYGFAGNIDRKNSNKLYEGKSSPVEVKNVGVVLLAGGKGKRMKASVPKQFLPILGKQVFLRSLDIFSKMPSEIISSIVIVLDKSYRDEYKDIVNLDSRIRWADPGAERQDSVFNGLLKTPDNCSVVAIHDAARPCVTESECLTCFQDGIKHGAAVLGVPMKATVKESIDGSFVTRTIPRSTLWEIHTPQVATKALLMKGFQNVKENNLEVTDDVSVIEVCP